MIPDPLKEVHSCKAWRASELAHDLDIPRRVLAFKRPLKNRTRRRGVLEYLSSTEDCWRISVFCWEFKNKLFGRCVHKYKALPGERMSSFLLVVFKAYTGVTHKQTNASLVALRSIPTSRFYSLQILGLPCTCFCLHLVYCSAMIMSRHLSPLQAWNSLNGGQYLFFFIPSI